MKALLRGERNGSVGVVLGLVGMLCLLGVSMGLAIYGMTNLHKLRVTLYERCVVRQNYDQAQALAREAMVRDLTDRIEQESHNRFIDEELRRSRVASAQRTRAALQAAIDATPPPGCKPYR